MQAVTEGSFTAHLIPFQAIIPREASKGIILGEASYTLIDDNGVEFYLSDRDRKKRERGEEGDSRWVISSRCDNYVHRTTVLYDHSCSRL